MKSMKVVAAAVVLGAGGVLSLQANAVDTFPTVINTGSLVTDTVGPNAYGTMTTRGVGSMCNQLQNQSSYFQSRNLNCR